jgi:NADH-quinone oxidoreductase subunit E
MRPKATGAESKAGKINGGKAVGKDTAGAPADGAISAGAEPAKALGTTSDTHPDGKVDTAKPKRSPRKKPQGDL